MADNIRHLFIGDPRCEALLSALEQTLYERGEAIPIPSVLGVIELLKHIVVDGAKS